MRRPNFSRLRLSAARFLPPLPKARQSRTRWSPSAPVLSWRYYLRVSIVGLLALACLAPAFQPMGDPRAVQLAIVIDTSHSMGAGGDSAAINRVSRTLEILADHLSGLAADAAVCLVLREVDVSIHKNLSLTIDDLRNYQTRVRAVGADGAALLRAATNSGENCDPNQAIVLTDRPAPAAPSAKVGGQVIWLDLSTPAGNWGFANFSRRAPSLVQQAPPVMEISQYGKVPRELSVLIESSAGQTRAPIDVSNRGPWQLAIDVPEGPVRLTLIPGGAYDGDDRVRFIARKRSALKVDWRIKNPPMPRHLGWEMVDNINSDAQALLVSTISPDTDYEKIGSAVLVYRGIEGDGSGIERRIGRFVEGSGLLEAVNFDLLEERMRASENSPAGFSPILQDEQGAVVIAARADPRAVLIPGPVGVPDGNGQRLWLTLLFNSLRWVLSGTGEVAQVNFVGPDGDLVPNAFLESNTAEAVRSVGEIRDIRPVKDNHLDAELWPWLVMLATILFAFERIVGVSWRESDR